MIKLKYIIVFLALTSKSSFSQITFNNIDTLLFKNFEAVNKQDSLYYLSLINQAAIFKGKSFKTKTDSLLLINLFFESFKYLVSSLKDMTTNSDFTVSYINYEFKNKKAIDSDFSGKIPLHVNILINNTFTLKLPFKINVSKGIYSIEEPMMVMFVESKE